MALTMEKSGNKLRAIRGLEKKEKIQKKKAKHPQPNLAIVTGTGRCGTSIFNKIYCLYASGQDPGTLKSESFYGSKWIEHSRAGYETPKIDFLNREVDMWKRQPENVPSRFAIDMRDLIKKGMPFIQRYPYSLKSPSFYQYCSYDFWQEVLFQKHKDSDRKLIVYLLKRNDLENVIKSAHTIGEGGDDGRVLPNKHLWNKTPKQLENLYQRNITMLKYFRIPYVQIEFPKFVEDPEYLVEMIASINSNVNQDKLLKIAKAELQPNLVTHW